MSTAAVTPSSSHLPMQTYFQNRSSDLRQLSQALNAGDLAGAQQAFSAIQTLAQSSPFANSDAFAISQRQQDFSAVGQAIQSGNLAGAQQAFPQLKSTFSGHHHHHGSRVVNPPAPAATVSLSAAATNASSANNPSSGASASVNPGNGAGSEQITINLSNISSGQQLTIGISEQQGQGPEITINFGQNRSQQTPATLPAPSSSASSQGSALNVVA